MRREPRVPYDDEDQGRQNNEPKQYPSRPVVAATREIGIEITILIVLPMSLSGWTEPNRIIILGALPGVAQDAIGFVYVLGFLIAGGRIGPAFVRMVALDEGLVGALNNGVRGFGSHA